MNNKLILNNQEFDLPKKRKGNDFVTVIETLFQNLLTNFNQFDGLLKSKLAPKIPLIELQCASIVSAITKYYQGYPQLAYNELKLCLDKLKGESILPIQDLKVSTGLDEYYRVRISYTSLNKLQMFHIPFHLREKVSTQRYSIPGLPCLYLGDSIYICWEELGRPEVNQMHISRFNFNESGFKFLFFNETIDNYRRRCFVHSDSGDPAMIPGLVSYLSFFPLLLSCSFQVDKPNEVFKPEYIVPQLLLQWIVGEHDLAGIKYRSNRIEHKNSIAGTFSNLAIPVKKIESSDFCPILKEKIKFTEPISWQLVDIVNDSQKLKLSIEEISRSTRRVRKIELIDGEPIDYFTTKFSRLEDKLRAIKDSSLSE